MLRVDVSPGVVGAAFFIIFDVLILALLDVVLAHVVCSVYYRNIHHGRPISVKSADIPGVTTYLLGKLFSLTNIVALSLKVAFIAIVFTVNVDVDGEVVSREIPESRHATFDFDPSPAAWDNSPNRSITRNLGFTRSCYNHTFEAESFVVFRTVFDVQGGNPPENETVGAHGSIPIDDNALACLGSGVKEPQIILNVTGCSPFLTEQCANGTVAEFPADITPLDDEGKALLPKNGDYQAQNFIFPIDVFNRSDMSDTFPQYTDPTLYCGTLCPGLEARRCCTFSDPENCNKPIRPCVLIAYIGNDTLIERWQYSDEGSIPRVRRDFPGPTIQGRWNISLSIVAAIILDLNLLMDWRTLALNLVTESSVYRKADIDYVRLEDMSVTLIPTYAVILGAVALLAAVVSRIIVFFTIGKDDRPRFNSIDGLSSIVREENAPSGRSYESGATALVGLSDRGMGSVHFGPLLNRQQSIARGLSKIS